MDHKLVFAGVGGQGIVLATRLIGTALTLKGIPVISTENHGMATRGGSVLAFMKVGNYNSPLILYEEADIAVILHPDEYQNAAVYTNPDTFVVGYNTPKSTVDIKETMERCSVHPRRANVVAAGLVLKHMGIDEETALSALSILNKASQENIKAIKVAYREVSHAHVSATA